MTKLEELKAAFEAATPGEWGEQDGIIWGESCVDNSDESYLVCDLAGDPISAVNEQDVQNGHFITLAHNLMPALLKAASLVPPEKPLPDLMLASYHEAIGWNACREAMIAAAQGEK